MLPLFNSKAWLTAFYLFVHSAGHFCNGVTVPASTLGLYHNYYNSGFAQQPIRTMPNYSSLTPARSTFVYNTDGHIANPQLPSFDPYCGGEFYGYLYVTMTAKYVLGIESKDGFAVKVNNQSFSSNSKLPASSVSGFGVCSGVDRLVKAFLKPCDCHEA